MKQLCDLSCMTRGLGVRAGARNFQPHLNAEGRLGFRLMLQHHVGSGNRRHAMQVLELFLHLTVPGGLGVEAEIVEGGFHIRSGLEVALHPVWAERHRVVHV